PVHHPSRPSFPTRRSSDLVVPAFQADPAPLPGRGHRAGFHQLLVGYHFGADEPPLEIGVDDAGGLGRLRPPADRPRPHFLLAGGDRKSTRLNSSHVKISYA